MSNIWCSIIDKNYTFRRTVAINGLYPKIYAPKQSVYTICATAWRILYAGGLISFASTVIFLFTLDISG